MAQILVIYSKGIGLRGANPPAAQFRQAGIRRSGVTGCLPIDGQIGIHRDANFATQAIERQATHQIIGRSCLTINQQVAIFARPDEKVEHRLALRGQQPGIGGQGARYIIGYQSLQKPGDILASFQWGQPDYGAISQAVCGHG